MYERTYGNKYEKGLTTKEIAVCIRTDIKAAVQNGLIPKGVKTSVRYSRFAGGSSIDVRITAVPPDFRIQSPEFLRWQVEHPDKVIPRHITRYTLGADRLLSTLRDIHRAYNHDGSEIMVDYFDVKYYGQVVFNWELERAERETFVGVSA